MEELQDTVDTCTEALTSFQNIVEDKDIILYLGLTRSGKSTLINSLIETDLEAIYVRQKNTYKIKKVIEDSSGPEISQGSVSSTSIPTLYPYNNSLLMDTPGFFDNRGPKQEIINALYLKQIQHAKTCKFVLVCDYNEIIQDNIQQFISALESLVCLVNSPLSTSLSIVFTKVPFEYPRHYIIEVLHNILEQPLLDISYQARELIHSFVLQPELVSFFRMPVRESLIINDQLLEGHDAAVFESGPLNMQNIEFSFVIRPETEMNILSALSEFIESVDFSKCNTSYQTYFDYFHVRDYVYASTTEELIHLKSEISDFKLKVYQETTRSFGTVDSVLNSITRLSRLDKSSDFYRNMLFYSNFSQILHSTIHLKLIEKYEIWIKELNKLNNKLISKIDEEQNVRCNMKFEFQVEAGVTGGGAILSILGGIGLRVAAIEALPAILPAAAAAAIPPVAIGATVVGAVTGLVSLGLGINRMVQNHIEYKRRIEKRREQGRPCPT